jgi:hypothetical protein
MATQNTIDKSHVVVNGVVKITEVVEKTLNREELLREKIEFLGRQQTLLNQIALLQKQYDALTENIKNIDDMINEIDNPQNT